MRRLILALICLGLILGFVPTVATAADTSSQSKNKGLYISPLRTQLTLQPGDSVTRAFTVANLTDAPMTVTTHVEQFSVSDYSYDYQFTKANNDWVHLVERAVTLQPYESHELAYVVKLPTDATPGGHYYTLYASTAPTDTTTSTVRATTLLYLTVNGDLSRTAQVVQSSLPSFVISPQITYSLDIRNTGNVHYTAYIASRVDGLGYQDAPSGTSQLLMPGATRQVQSSINSPLLPGIYKLSYTVKPEQGEAITGSQYFLFLPPWAVAILIIVFAVITHYVTRRLRPEQNKNQK